MIEAAARAGVRSVVCLSTDKAVYPVNAMGMTKALMEKTAQAFARNNPNSTTTVALTRYGNVMYSRGSVIPLFIQQLQAGKPLTVTEPHDDPFPDVAASSRSISSTTPSSMPRPGDLFVRKAPASTVETLARAVASLLGDDDPEIRVIGSRHGEKLHETLLSREEMVKSEDQGEYFRVPLDARSLQYELYFDEGETRTAGLEDYTSENTDRLSVEETKDLLLTIPEFAALLERSRGLMRVVMTGADGFLGWHTRVRLRALTDHDGDPRRRGQLGRLPELVASADAVLHFAGVNRASDREVEEGNAQLARDLADAVRRAPGAPTIVYANTIQAGNGTPYGTGKAVGRRRSWPKRPPTKGSPFADVVLPNLFGEHGRPNYNSFVATFAHKVAAGEHPQVQDREVDLLHVQDAARAFIDELGTRWSSGRSARGHARRASRPCWRSLPRSSRSTGAARSLPLPSRLHVNLFNTLRAAMFPCPLPDPAGAPYRPSWQSGRDGSCTRQRGPDLLSRPRRPAITRGQHFHLRKAERFVVVGGQARISLRKVLTDEVVAFDVDGSSPAIIDMPTLWAHKITNTGRW